MFLVNQIIIRAVIAALSHAPNRTKGDRRAEPKTNLTV